MHIKQASEHTAEAGVRVGGEEDQWGGGSEGSTGAQAGLEGLT